LKRPKSNAVNVGFIGTGFIAQQCHLPAFDHAAGCRIIAVADLHEDLAKRIGRRYEVDRVYRSHQDLLRDRDIEAVIITLPRFLTAGVCLDALNAGKKIFTEKPLSLNYESAHRLLVKSIELDLPLQVGYMRRFDCGVQELKRRISERLTKGERPILARAYCYMGDSYCNPFGDFKAAVTNKKVESIVETYPEWLHDDFRVGYEIYLNVYTHMTDLLTYLLEKPLDLKATGISHLGHGINLFSCDGIPVDISTAKCNISQWLEGVTIVYEDLVMELDFPPALLKNVPARLTCRSGSEVYEVAVIRPRWSWAFRSQAEAFISMCLDWPNSKCNVESAAAQVKLVSSIYERLQQT